MKTYTLLVWEEIPDNTKLYIIPDDEINEEHRGLLQQAHGKFININDSCEDNDGLSFLNVALVERNEQTVADNANQKYLDHLGIFNKYRKYDAEHNITKDILQETCSISLVIVSGFAC